MGGGEIIADHRHQPDGGEHGAGEAKVAGPAAENVGRDFGRRVHRVEGDRTDHQDRLHGFGH